MMTGCVLVACLLWTAAAQGPARPARPAFKGMELYSWTAGGKEWRFSLLIGTNRYKPRSERTDPRVAIAGLEALKPKLAGLAEGELLLWGWEQGDEPPAAMIEELSRYCRELGIELRMPAAKPEAPRR